MPDQERHPLVIPFTAALVGAICDRRRHAAWWKSFLTLLPGSAFFIALLLTMTAILGYPASASQATLAGFYATIGCIWLLGVPLAALPVAGCSVPEEESYLGEESFYARRATIR